MRVGRMLLTALLWAFLLTLLSWQTAGAQTRDIYLNERVVVRPGEAQTLIFSATANNIYTFRSFDGQAKAELYLEGESEPVVSGDGFSMQARLISDKTYRLVVTPEETGCEVEIMRSALGRSFDDPIALNDLGGGYDKVIARAYDTHWFRFTAPQTTLYSIRTQSEINTVGYLLDQKGNRITMSDNVYSPYGFDFRIQAHLTAGETYYIRVSGRGEETGPYHLTINMLSPDQKTPEKMAFSVEELTLQSGETALVSAFPMPENAAAEVIYLSANPEIATVSADGQVHAVAPGETQLIAVGLGWAEARIPVYVRQVPIEAIVLKTETLTLHAGQQTTLEYTVEPAQASDQTVAITSENPKIVRVGRSGVLSALAVGETNLILSAGDIQKVLPVRVQEALPRYRALLMGEQRYADGRIRVGSVNTTQGMYDLLTRQSLGEKGYEAVMRMDSTRSEAVAAIRETFRDAQPTDVSLFYINCHGGLQGTLPYLEFHDGSRLNARQLYKELSAIPGRIILLIDCCNSGGFLSAREVRTFTGGVTQIFSGGAATPFLRSKYFLMTSASLTQDSYRISYDGANSESSMSTAFSRSLAEAGGWDLIEDKARRLRADSNQDGKVTLWEAYQFVYARVKRHLKGSKAQQDVQVFPRGSSFTLFARE